MNDEKSDMLEASELINVEIESMSLVDLQDHADKVLATINKLNQFINYPVGSSANKIVTANRRSKNLRAHMTQVRKLIVAHVNSIAATMPTNSTSGAVAQILFSPPTCRK